MVHKDNIHIRLLVEVAFVNHADHLARLVHDGERTRGRGFDSLLDITHQCRGLHSLDRACRHRAHRHRIKGQVYGAGDIIRRNQHRDARRFSALVEFLREGLTTRQDDCTHLVVNAEI